MGFLSNKISRDEVKPGDHIYSWRQAYVYAHHGIYVGDGQVNHFTRGDGQETGTGTFLDKIIVSSSHNHGDNPCPNCGDRSKLGGVISSCLECFLAGGDLYVFEYSVSPAIFLAKPRGGICTIASSDPPEEAIYRANFLLQYGFGVYNVFKNNCEDFAIYCKTGLLVANTDVGRSGQAATMVAAASVLLSSPLRLVAGFGGLAVAGCGMYCVGRLVSDIGMRWDASKVPVERLVADEVDKSEMEAKPVADEVDKSEMEAKPVADEVDKSEMEAKPVADVADKSEMEAKPVADVADKSEMEAKPVADAADKSEMEAKPEDKKTS